MKKCSTAFIVVIFILMWGTPGRSHFGMLIPGDSMVMQKDHREIVLTLSFSHPFEMQGMEMAKAMVRANGAGALACLTLGAQPSMPTASALGRFLRDHQV